MHIDLNLFDLVFVLHVLHRYKYVLNLIHIEFVLHLNVFLLLYFYFELKVEEMDELYIELNKRIFSLYRILPDVDDDGIKLIR